MAMTYKPYEQVGHISAASDYPNVAECLAPIMDHKLSGSAGGILTAYYIGHELLEIHIQCTNSDDAVLVAMHLHMHGLTFTEL